MEARTRNRGPAGGESGGVERHARHQLGSVLVRTEHQMRSLVSITANADPPQLGAVLCADVLQRAECLLNTQWRRATHRGSILPLAGCFPA